MWMEGRYIKWRRSACSLGSLAIFLAGCSGCPRSNDDIPTITGTAVTLQEPPPPRAPEPPPVAAPKSVAPAVPPPLPAKPPARETTPSNDLLSTLLKAGPPPVPPGSYIADDLTQRLKEKMADAYEGDMSKVPDAKIYLGPQDLANFTKFYEQRGYKTQRVTIPISQIIQSAVRDRPELADRVKLDDYDGIVIEQVMVEGTGVSASDKYIDPDTLKVVDKLFITVMPLK